LWRTWLLGGIEYYLLGMGLLVALGCHELEELDVPDMRVELVLELEVVGIHLVLQHGHIETKALLLYKHPATMLGMMSLPTALANLQLNKET